MDPFLLYSETMAVGVKSGLRDEDLCEAGYSRKEMALSVLWPPLPRTIVYPALLSMEAVILPAHDEQRQSIRLVSIVTLSIVVPVEQNTQTFQTSQEAAVAFSRNLTASPSGRIHRLATTASTEAELNVFKRW